MFENPVLKPTHVKVSAPPLNLKPSLFKTNLERFRYICKDLPSPQIFIDFDFYVLISGSLARKVWIGAGDTYRLFPNLFIISVGEPGVGKTLPAEAVNKLFEKLTITELKDGNLLTRKLVNLGPDAVSVEKLILRAQASCEAIKCNDPLNPYYEHSSCTFCLPDELGMLFTDQTKRIVTFLMKCWDCKTYEGDTIKHGVTIIKNSCINLLGCITPEDLKGLMQQRVFSTGFVGRCIFLWGDKQKQKGSDLIIETPEQENEKEHIKQHLIKLCQLPPSPIVLSPDASHWLSVWVKERSEIVANTHPKLKDYYARKKALLIKLATNNHFADKLNLVLDVEDFIAAEKLLLWAEMDMHKALCCAGENPLSDIATEIVEYIKLKGITRKKTLMLNFYYKTDKLEDVFTYLTQTGQLTEQTDGGLPAFVFTGNK